MDTAGQEFFGKTRPSYYRGASAAIITFDNGDRDSYKAVKKLYKEFRKHIPQVLICAEYLVKNKKIVIDERLGTGRYITSKFSTIIKLLNAGLSVPKTYQPLTRGAATKVAGKLGYPLIFLIEGKL